MSEPETAADDGLEALDERAHNQRDGLGGRFARERPAMSGEVQGRQRDVLMHAALEQWRPAQLRTLLWAYLTCGLVLLGVAALGVAGAGPLAF